ncbi:AhpC/TSA family protein [Dyadobacter sp. CY261]|uniref:TlpA disulfide reductase family protein n=1 Tax=Dyadobacter sp. CY261 TaxID=2907203 RepID=UPI001F3AF49C|nr:TlpA disulfide reductase family protein [Dyadobacter sp. CY261]MCF0072441.1 AhpC/TSA family protein [Dyadobacter sp. CY261]
MKIYALLVIDVLMPLFLLWGCTHDRARTITGDLKSADTFLEGRKVYLKNWETRLFVDSSRVTNGKFSFDKAADTSGFPFRASIYYETGDSSWPHRIIGFRNPIHKNYGESAFYAEPGKMELVLDTIIKRNRGEEVIFIIEELGKQTLVSFQHPRLKVGQTPEDLKYNKSVITRYPSSIELLETLYANRSHIDTAQLRSLISLFSPALSTHTAYIKTIGYLNAEDQANAGFPKIKLKTPTGSFITGIKQNKAPYHLVVFWASWCAPCRKEIPQLKRLLRGNEQMLAITSISIDEKEDQWQKALVSEKMPWDQLLVADASSIARLDKEYDISAIPVWILLDSKGKLIMRHMGYEEGKDGVDGQVELLLLRQSNADVKKGVK